MKTGVSETYLVTRLLDTLHRYLEAGNKVDVEFWKLHGRLRELKELILHVRSKR